jgi:hypothetical protein
VAAGVSENNGEKRRLIKDGGGGGCTWLWRLIEAAIAVISEENTGNGSQL